MKFGINAETLDEKFLRTLSIKGCIPALCFFENSKKNYTERKYFEEFKKRISNETLKQIPKSENQKTQQKLLLLQIHNEVADLPFSSLINDMNGIKLNKKIWLKGKGGKRIKDFQYGIKHKKLSSKEDKFIPSDYKKIRQAIIWLNWFYRRPDLSLRPRNDSLCLSSSAVQEFNLNQKNLFKNMRDNKLKDFMLKIKEDSPKLASGFFSCISLDLFNLIKTKVITREEIKNISRGYEFFCLNVGNINKFNKLSAYYIFHPKVFSNETTLKKLSKIGYLRLGHLKCFRQEFIEYLDHNYLKELHKKFSDFNHS